VEITRIDTEPVKAEISYVPAIATSENVLATLHFNKTGVVITNANFFPFQPLSMGESVDYLFTGNGYYQFSFVDPAGNTGTATAVVTRIDRTPPVAKFTYVPSTTTNQDVLATLTTDEPLQTPIGRTKLNATTFTRLFTGNTSTEVSLVDMVGNVLMT
jgi:hypothetical protein